MKDDVNNIKNQMDSTLRQVSDLQGEINRVRNDYEMRIEDMTRGMGNERKRKMELEVQVTSLQSDKNKQEVMHREALRKRDSEVKVQEDRARKKNNELNGVRRELEEVKGQLKDSDRKLENSYKQIKETEKQLEELRERGTVGTHAQTSVAITEPGPCRRGEETEQEDPIDDSTFLHSTGGNYGDTEGDNTYTMPPPHLMPPPTEGEKA